MKNDEITTYKQAWNAKPDTKSPEESYKALVDHIKGMYNGKLSDVEAHTAARNFIEFVKILLKYHKKEN
jgi:hypothetical protein